MAARKEILSDLSKKIAEGNIREAYRDFEELPIVDQIAVSFEYNTSLFKPDTIDNWQKLFVQLLKEITESSSLPVFIFPIFSTS